MGIRSLCERLFGQSSSSSYDGQQVADEVLLIVKRFHKSQGKFPEKVHFDTLPNGYSVWIDE